MLQVLHRNGLLQCNGTERKLSVQTAVCEVAEELSRRMFRGGAPLKSIAVERFCQYALSLLKQCCVLHVTIDCSRTALEMVSAHKEDLCQLLVYAELMPKVAHSLAQLAGMSGAVDTLLRS